MIDGGEDPKFIARRMVIFASEDIGNADPYALTLAVSVFHAVELIGLPEARINLAQGATYLASCPKSNASYEGIGAALSDVKKGGASAVPPLYLRNAPTDLMKEIGYGEGYRYPHNYPSMSTTFLNRWSQKPTTDPPARAEKSSSANGWRGCGKIAIATDCNGLG
jgi:putative ATPase